MSEALHEELEYLHYAGPVTPEFTAAKTAYWAGVFTGQYWQAIEENALTFYHYDADQDTSEQYGDNPYFLAGIATGVRFVETDPRRHK